MSQVKALAYALFAQGGLTHQQVADKIREAIPHAQTTARSVASMAVDYRRGGGEAKPNEARGRVKALVYALFEEGGYTHKEVAAKVRAAYPEAQTTDKSVASMKVDWARLPKATLQADMFHAFAAAMGEE